VQVGNEVQPLPDVGRTRAVCSQYRLRNGVLFRFHVSTNKVEPAMSNRCCNLLTKDDSRATLADEAMPLRPEVTRVCKPFPFTCAGEAWAGAGASPHGAVILPSCEPEGVGPNRDACEEMTLGVASEVIGLDICDASFIYVSRGHHSSLD